MVPLSLPRSRAGCERRRLLAGGLVGLVLLGAAGCSSTAPPSGPAVGAGTTEATYAIVPDAEVTAGLADIRQMGNDVKRLLATDPAAATAKTTEMYTRWYTFEGTIKKNDKVLYLQIEDGLASIRSGAEEGRSDLVDKGIADVAGGATLYLRDHP